MIAAVILTFPLGRRATAKKPPAGPAGKPLQQGSRLRMEPAELKGLRRVQWHPSRFSESALQTLKILMGPC
ncbi:hypothetical protein NDU88_005120 [Pleurodeles waltl]|uniref:Uncharacterized protein n=1 Tax=Pleurodeles waltl TaxID=8319 RepID=A0AAV7M9G4_PLEWA|nr:hypothetical protein NDU88_005120 [Pleurodeles waltl]